MMVLLQITFFILGLLLVLSTIYSALETFVVPRGTADLITNTVFRLVRGFFNLLLKFTKNYSTRDRLMALYAPVSVLLLLPVWLVLVTIVFSAMYWATGIDSIIEDFTISGLSLLTLGFAKGDSPIHTIFAFAEATIG
jgi:hypothetical protein